MRFLMMAGAALAAMALIGCGGEDKISEDEAEEIAEAALLRESDLPGSGWEEIDRDNFEEDDEDFPETEACEALNEFFEDLEDEGDEPLVETNVTYARAADPIDIEVESEISVYATTSSRLDLQERGDELFEDAGFDDCMEDFAAQAGEDVGGTGEYDRRDPSGDVPDDGFAMAFGFSIELGSERVEVVGELYIWHEEHVESFLSVFGTPEQLNEDRVQDIIDEAQERVRSAQE